MTFLFYILLFFFLILCALMSSTILIQEAKSLGLGASFGGDSGDSLFGTSTAEVLKRFTAYLGAFFLIGCLVLSLWGASIGRRASETVETPIESVE